MFSIPRPAGAVTRTYGHLPFGDTWYETGPPSKWKFTNYEREDDSRPDYANFRMYSPKWGRFMSADPIGPDLSTPMSWNRFAYVTNDPVNSGDPFGLCQQNSTTASGDLIVVDCGDPKDITQHPELIPLQVGDGYDHSGSGPLGRGPGNSSGGGTPDVNKHYGTNTPCVLADQVMKEVESNFARFGNYSAGTVFVAFNPPARMNVGSTIPINVGMHLGIYATPTQTISVNVQSMNSQAMTFSTNPGHLLYPGAITFAATAGPNGSVNFNINLSGKFPNLIRQVEFALGGGAFEDAQWNQFLNKVRALCKGGH